MDTRWWGVWLLVAGLVTPSSGLQPVVLTGTGATLPAVLYVQWDATHMEVRRPFVNLSMTYKPHDSRAGQVAMMTPANESEYAYGATDALFTDAEFDLHPDLQMLPVVGGAVVMTYNIPDLYDLNLTRAAIVGVYNGSVTHWNDPLIQAANPGYVLPGEGIHVVARLDYSGTTEIFTAALSAFSPEWNDTYGTFPEGQVGDNSTRWHPAVINSYGRQSTGMMGMIFSYRYSIGYLSVADALAVNFTYARVYNRAGNLVDVTPDGMRRPMNDTAPLLGTRLTASLVDSPAADAYPIIGYSYFVVRMTGMEDCALAVELARYIDWLTTSPYADAEAYEMRMTQVTPDVAGVIHQRVLEAMTCGPGADNVWAMVEAQKEDELHSVQGWRVPVFVAVPIIIILIALLLSYLVYQQVKLRRIALSDEWFIPFEAIHVRWERAQGWMTTSKSRFGSTTTGLTTHSTGDMSGIGLIFAGPNDVLGTWKDHKVGLRKFPNPDFRVTRNATKIAINMLRTQIVHVNVQRFFGVCLVDEQLHLASEHAEKGSLTDILQNPSYELDANFKYVMALDVATGMDYLHNQGLVHGNLTSNCCLLDARWNVRVANWELNRLYGEQRARKPSKVHPMREDDTFNDPNINARANLWVAPEILRCLVAEPNRKSDAYSFGILLIEVFTREDPYQEALDEKTPVEVVNEILAAGLRPAVSSVEGAPGIVPIMQAAWDEDPAARPAFTQLSRRINKARPSKKSVIEIMMVTLEGYVTNLEEMVQERTVELETVNSSLESLLHQILPPSVATKLSRGEAVDPETFDSVTIFFSDIVHFTDLCGESSPMEVVTLLNDLYTCFDSIIDELDVYKVETIGDAYMCISGLPERNGIEHAGNVATMGLMLLEAVTTFRVRHRPQHKIQLRAGVHSGSVVAGVVGLKMPRYCLFGDTVNTASRMESNSLPMKIQASPATKELLDSLGGYRVVERGTMEIKGKGKMKTYFIEGKEESATVTTEDFEGLGDSWQSLREILTSPAVGTRLS